MSAEMFIGFIIGYLVCLVMVNIIYFLFLRFGK